jgi:uncharacterized membrane protein YbhN (UPF0104 family)
MVGPIQSTVWMRTVNEPPLTKQPPDAAAPPRLGGGVGFFADYFWFLVKNVVGWVLILLAFALGPVPGPGGIVVFLIGFGMISFPGKRRLIVRIFRGRRFELNGALLHAGVVVLAALLTVALMEWFVWRERGRWHGVAPRGARLVLTCAGVAVGAWVILQGLLRLGNWIVGIMPKFRRVVRPWLRHRGIDLLPPRLRRRVHLVDGTFAWSRHEEGEILRVHERHRARLSRAWQTTKPWLRRLAGVGITVAIFAWMLKPVVLKWDQVGDRVKSIDWGMFALAAVMFATFLFAFRLVSWRRILKGFGHKLPYAAATRIWSTSELARYLPGVIWQVVGRVYLVKPYGVSGAVCSTSQILELVVFLLANVLVALGCLAFFAYRMDGFAKTYLYAAAVLAPLLMLILHPRVFYTALTKYMTWRGKELPAKRVRGKTLAMLTLWGIVGLFWQSLAIWLITKAPLGLPIEKWWVVAGSYCLAWCAGFIAFWAPGGLGVREFVFVTAMQFALPPWVRATFGDEKVLYGFLAFLGILLRLWTIAGELILTGIAYAADYRGALGRADAPGRVVASVVE